MGRKMPIHKTRNEHFFKTWSPEMTYVLGFFAADGSMSETQRGGHYIEFQITDGDLLQKIKCLLGSGNRISARKRSAEWKTIYRLQIGSAMMFQDLERLGFTARKSKTLMLPKIPRKYFGHFARGYFDGDGNVWSGTIHKFNRPHPSVVLMACFTSGSEKFLASLKENFKIYANITGGSLSFSGRGFHLQYASLDSLKLYRFMYYHSRDLYLTRKKDVFERFLRGKQVFISGPVV